MTVLIDTPIWSLAYRRKGLTSAEQSIVDELRGCIEKDHAVMIGAVRQEVLSGLTDLDRWQLLRTTLRAFEDLPLIVDDFEQAATIYNQCRAVGVQGSHIDFLLCAVSQRNDASIFTTDRDFSRFAEHIDIRLHKP